MDDLQDSLTLEDEGSAFLPKRRDLITPWRTVIHQNGNLQGKMTFRCVIHTKLHRLDDAISLLFLLQHTRSAMRKMRPAVYFQKHETKL